ncbi:MAG: hypothetical protein HY063_04160 [Bacteroidetes bacterium]|nr:hypothetical protein [Bacteroidota bacterium]
MKQLITLLLFILSVHAFAQDYYNKEEAKNKDKKEIPPPTKNDSAPKFYLGIGSGLNNYNGLLGIGANLRIHKTMFLLAGAGIGSWGNKVSAGIKYTRKFTSSWGYAMSYSHSTGLKDFKTQLETTASKPNGTEEVVLDLLPASTVNAAASYNWFFRRNKLFYIEFGYGVSIETAPYVIKNGVTLTNKSKQVLQLLQPGGVIFGIGFMWGI